MIPETIAGHISALVPFSFPKWWIEVRLFKVHIIINFFSLQDDLIVDDDDLLNDDDDDLLDD